MYLHPELHDVSLQDTPRTLDHEMFAVCVLIFKILMIGQDPYILGDLSSPKELITQGKFPYPLGLEPYNKNPVEVWIPLWHGIDSELKKLLHQTFVKHSVPSLLEVAVSLGRYLEQVEIWKLFRLS